MKSIDIASYNKTLNLMRKFTLAALAVFFAVNLSAHNKSEFFKLLYLKVVNI